MPNPTRSAPETSVAHSLPDAPTPDPAAPELGAATFEEMGLTPEVLERVRAAGYTRPTPIQSLFIPKVLSGRDVLGQAKTGTGKTAAFLLPLFQRVKPGSASPAVLILAPTRELALQIFGEVEKLGQGLGFSAITLYGGTRYEPQIAALEKGVDLVVGTPGRLMDHMRARRLDLSGIQAVVLDEADRMLDLGFRKDIEYILRHCPTRRQTLLLSATVPPDILKLAKRFMHEPEEIWTAPENLTVDQVEQFYSVVERDKKFPLLLKIIDEEKPGLAIVFCATKIGAKKLAAKLKQVHLMAREIHGDLVQAKREKIMGHFRKGRVKILVATDVASRGLDVQDITHIINYDVPYKTEDYVHRIGRTGRMDKSGKAFTFVTLEEASFLTDIEVLINRQLIAVQFQNMESRFWPNPPKEAPPEFIAEDEETQVTESDYISLQHDGGGARRERGSRDRGSRDRSSDRSARGHFGPAAHAQPGRAAHAVPKSGSSGDSGNASPAHRRRGHGSSRGPVEITCSTCGIKTTVSFKPDPRRPVYCDPCYAVVKAGRPAPGASRES